MRRQLYRETTRSKEKLRVRLQHRPCPLSSPKSFKISSPIHLTRPSYLPHNEQAVHLSRFTPCRHYLRPIQHDGRDGPLTLREGAVRTDHRSAIFDSAAVVAPDFAADTAAVYTTRPRAVARVSTTTRGGRFRCCRRAFDGSDVEEDYGSLSRADGDHRAAGVQARGRER